ncbi:MAG: hypothetical protein IAE82_21035 [Opitutaceae bacterium]|nr:hypothetical protein [Opitutaceae bacterium]
MSGTPSTVAPSRARAIFYFSVIFLAGAIVGSALTIGIGRTVIQRAKNPVALNAEVLRRLDRHLDLTPAQRERVRPILIDMAIRLREVRAESRREWTSTIQDARDRLRAELTPEQQVEFDRLAVRMRDNFGRLLGAPPEPGARRLAPAPQPPTQPEAPAESSGSGL